jgi:hypothetical protein
MGRRTVIAAAMLGLVALGTLALTRGDRAEAAAYSFSRQVDSASQDTAEAPAGEGPSGQAAAGQATAAEFTAQQAIDAFYAAARGPDQPLPFNHRFHSGELQIDCLYCHTGTDVSQTGVMPPLEICMGCHRVAGSGLEPIEALRGMWDAGAVVEWDWVYKLPEFVQFNHEPHLRNAVECEECHGPVEEEMDRIYQWAPLTMGWCLECHREPPAETDVATDHVLSERYPPPEMPVGRQLKGLYPIRIDSEFGASRGPIDCLACHY